MKKQIPIISPVIFVIILFSFSTFPVVAQTRPLTDSFTPAALAPGSPVGTYPLSGFETVNLYSGHLNFSLPVYQFDGRGETGYPLSINIERNWQFRSYTFWTGPGTGSNPTFWYYAHSNFWDGIRNSYGPGVMQGRPSRDRSPIGSPDGTCFTLTKLTFKKSDGTEIELRDRQTDGTAYYQSGYNTFSRGQIFDDKYSSSMTFVSDAPISDVSCAENGIAVMNGFNVIYPSGYLYINGGIRYRIDNGGVTSIRDRNGNTMSLATSSATSTSFSISDNLGRSIDVGTFGGWNSTSQTIGDNSIISPRNNQQTRSVTAQRTLLENSLRSDYSIKTYRQLFPTATYLANETSTFNDAVVSKIVLPDGRDYRLKYNDYGELARVELPTGGAIEYDWFGYGDYSGDPSGYIETTRAVYRRVKERRVYSNGDSGSGWESKTVYEVITPGTIEVRQYANNNGQDVLLSKSRHYFHGNPETSMRSTTHRFYTPLNEGKEYKTELYDESGNLKQTVENTFACQSGSNTDKTTNCNISQTKLTLSDTGQVSLKTFAYDQFNNLTDTYEYDYGAGSPGSFKRRTHTDFVNDPNYTAYTGSYLRSLPAQNWISSDINGTTKVSLKQYEYDNYTGDGNNASLYPRSNVIGHDTNNYGTNYWSRGNLTRITTYGNAQSQTEPISVYSNYDTLGNVIRTIDGKANVSTTDFADRFGSPDGEARTNTTPAELGSLSTFAFPTSATNALGWTTGYVQFDYYTEQPIDAEDINGVVSTTFYEDLLDRPTKNIIANNQPNYRRQEKITYNDALNGQKVTVNSDLNNFNDGLVKTERFFDKMGRTVKFWKYESDGGYIEIKSIPVALVQDPETLIWREATKVSNPYRPMISEQPVWTTSLSDSLSRKIKVITPDGAIIKTEYSGNSVMITDQAGRQRRSITNALGQLIRIDEPDVTNSNQLGTISAPYQPTNYSYDALNNLTTVSQGAQTRTFAYDSLSRLLSATNPESGMVSYTYDANGNIQTKRDVRGIKTVYDYDKLNRIVKKCFRIVGTGSLGARTCMDAGGETFEPNTSDVLYSYDNLPNARGRLIKVENGISKTEYQSFDVLGRVTQSQQVTDGLAYGVPMTYTYNLSGALIEQKYPSGRVVRNVLDNDGDFSIVQSKKNQTSGFWNYADNFIYEATGAVKSMQLGNKRWESTQFNSRLQPTQIGLGTVQNSSDKLKLEFNYGTTNNNGNILNQTIVVPTTGQSAGFTATQTYSYDSLNRLKSAEETVPSQTGWRQTFLYDRYGNRTIDEANTTASSNFPKNCGTAPNSAMCAADKKIYNPQIQASDNKLSANDGYYYDTSGNMLRDAQNRRFTYSAENKQIKVETIDSTGNTVNVLGEYFYDGDGKRVKKIAGNEVTIFVHDMTGKLVAEYSNQIAQNPTVSYLTNDHLGSLRITSDQNGAITARHDYQPFGEEIHREGYSADNLRNRFTSKERDNETDLDNFFARYYSSSQGRFLTADPLLKSAHPFNPQMWNRFSYVLNRPTVAVDGNGLSTLVVTVNPKDQNTPYATVRLVKKDGNYKGDGILALAAGVAGRDRSKKNADTPYGVYRAPENPTQGGKITSRLGKAYGTGKISFEPVAGEVVAAGRALIRIHGGGSAAPEPYSSNQGLYPTQGCVRTSNADVDNLIADINELADEADPLFRVFIGSQEYLTDLANQKDKNNNYLYPELRIELGLFKDNAEKEKLLQSYQQMLNSVVISRQKSTDENKKRKNQVRQ